MSIVNDTSIHSQTFCFWFTDDAIDALRALSTEAVLSPVQKDGVVVPLSTPFEDTSSETTEPTSMILHPVHESVASSSQVAGVLAGGISWGALIRDSFPEQAQGIMAVVKNTCDQSFSYYHDGADLSFRGEGDLHDSRYDDMEVVVNLSLNHASPRFESTKGHCLYSVVRMPELRCLCAPFLYMLTQPVSYCFSAHLSQKIL